MIKILKTFVERLIPILAYFFPFLEINFYFAPKSCLMGEADIGLKYIYIRSWPLCSIGIIICIIIKWYRYSIDMSSAQYRYGIAMVSIQYRYGIEPYPNISTLTGHKQNSRRVHKQKMKFLFLPT